MKRFTMFACLALTLVFAMNAFASDGYQLPNRVLGTGGVIYGGSSDLSKAAKDTVILVGPGTTPQVRGDFQDDAGVANWNGWTSNDVTQPTETHWHTSTYFADNLGGGAGNLALYCGIETIPACSAGDPVGGYGTNWYDILQYTYTVADPLGGCSVDVSGELNANSEPGYDRTSLVFETAGGFVIPERFDAEVDNYNFSANKDYVTDDYIGVNSDQIRVSFYFISDGGWDDTDCAYATHGAVQIDDVTVTCSNGTSTYFEDFEAGLGQWTPAFPQGVGDFSQLWSGLEDFDPCHVNYSPQAAFIDDGAIVPGVGPSLGDTWVYGPLTYVVNSTGGATRDNANKLHITIDSPVFDWPADPTYVGGRFDFTVYAHEGLNTQDPGMMWEWNIKSAIDEATLAASGWLGDGFVRYGGPAYIRTGFTVSSLLVPGATVGQVQLGVYELGWAWGADGNDGTPAPYFDDVRYKAYQKTGPSMTGREIDLAQDDFPAIGDIDLVNLGNNSVRFDMAQNIDLASQLTNTPGDSIVITVTSNRPGATLDMPVMHYTVQQNALFDAYRVGFVATGTITGYEAVNNGGQVVPDKFAFDLPDEFFLFPGDIVHYYFEATDHLGGVDETSTLPGNLDGYGDFSTPMAWNSSFQMACLPTILDAAGDTPDILFWNDFGNRGGENEWFGALNNIGLIRGTHYDVYYTNGPSSNVGNGLGGRATFLQMSGYNTLLYTCGTLLSGTIANGDPLDSISNDADLLEKWYTNYDAKGYFTGDGLASDLEVSGVATLGLLTNQLGISVFSNNLLPEIGEQTTPLVLAEASNSVFTNTTSWIAYGGCNSINTFDAVEPLAGAERLARFTDPNGAPAYAFSAATKFVDGNDVTISMPYDFMDVRSNPNDPLTLDGSPVASRVVMLEEILSNFGHSSTGRVPSDTPDAGKFFAKNYPNPFNPTTKIEFNMPKAGHLSLKVYNVRGELVKTLIDETQVAGAGSIMWDGTNDQGSSVSSGVYFYEARTAGDVQVNKMALVK